MSFFDETGEEIRRVGREFGAVTGRNRRCGWVDLVALRYAIMIKRRDGLGDDEGRRARRFETSKCVWPRERRGAHGNHALRHRRLDGGVRRTARRHTPLTEMRAKPTPQAYADYVSYLEKTLGTPITILSVGPDREATIVR